MDIRLVALDIDGTLLEPGAPVDARPGDGMSQAIAQLITDGVIIVLASGRMFPGTLSVAQHLGIDQPLICQQGASVHEHDGSLRHGLSINHEIALELLEYAQLNDWTLAWFDSQRYLVTRPCEQAQFFADVSMISMEVNAQPHLSGVRATGIDIISTAHRAPDVHAELGRRYGNKLCLLDFPSVTAVHSAAASKGNALAVLAAEMGIKASEVLAIGDSVNDVSMLSWADHSAAPAHCDSYARSAADEILPGDGIDGVIAKLQSLSM